MLYLIALLLLMLCGCVTPGHTVSTRPDPTDCSSERPPYCRPMPPEASAAQPQRTGYADAVAHLGIPTRKETFANGSFVAEWTRQQTGGYVLMPGMPGPLVMPGMMVPMSHGETIRLHFDAKEKLIGKSYQSW